MGLFSRIWSVGKAHANKAVEKLEDPSVMIDQAIADRRKALAEMRSKVANVIASYRQVEASYNKELAKVDEWQEHAKKALAKNNEPLALKAMERKQSHQSNADRLKPQVEAQEAAVNQLKAEMAKATTDLENFEREKHVLIAQNEAAKVKTDVYEARSKLGKGGTGDLMERMRKKTEASAAKADALGELAADDTSLEEQIADLGSSSTSAQDELAALKASMQG